MKINLPLAMGLGILGNHRPTRAPQGFFGGLGGGMAQGLQMYAQYQQQAQQAEMQKQRMEAYKRQVTAQEAKAGQEAEARKRRQALIGRIREQNPGLADAMEGGLDQWQFKALTGHQDKETWYNAKAGRYEQVAPSELTPDHYKNRAAYRSARTPIGGVRKPPSPKEVLQRQILGSIPKNEDGSYAFDINNPTHQFLITGKLPSAGGGSGKWALNTQTKQIEFVSPSTLLKNPGLYTKPPSGMRLKTNEDGTVEFATGDMAGGPNKAATNTLEKKIHELEALKSEFNSIDAKDSPRFLGLTSRLKGYAMETYDYLFGLKEGGEAEKYVSEKATFDSGVNQAFNAYRQQITGAAAAMKEITWLQNAFINTSVSPTVFKARYDQFQRKLERGIELAKAQLRTNPQMSRDEYMQIVDSAFGEGPSRNTSQPSVDTSVYGQQPAQQGAPSWAPFINPQP